MQFHDRVREQFRRLAAADPLHYLVLDAAADADVIAADIRTAVEALLKERST
jgi:dTMP kinase